MTVTVTSPSVPTLSLSAEPSSVASGGAATLTWTSTNATACTASNGWSGTRATSGTFDTGPLTSTTTFTLACNGAGGSVTQAATVTVTGVVAAPTVVLTANPTSIANGASSSLDWSSTDATTCTATGGWSGTKATSGSQATGALIATTSFTLGCTGPGGTGSASATVTVAPPIGPPPTATFPLRVEAGKRYLVDAQGRAFLMQGEDRKSTRLNSSH